MISEIEVDIDLFGDQAHVFVQYERMVSGQINIHDVQIGAPIPHSRQWRYQSILPFITSGMAFDLRTRIYKHLQQAHIRGATTGRAGHAAGI